MLISEWTISMEYQKSLYLYQSCPLPTARWWMDVIADRRNTLNFRVCVVGSAGRVTEHQNKKTLYTLRVCSMHGLSPAHARTCTGWEWASVFFLRSIRYSITTVYCNRAVVIEKHGYESGTKNHAWLGLKYFMPTTESFEYKKDLPNRRDLARKIDRNHNDARHVTRDGQWGRCILIHLPVPPTIGSFRALMVVYTSFSVFGTGIKLLPMRRDRSGHLKNDRVVPSLSK